jgi:hypothetical protein
MFFYPRCKSFAYNLISAVQARPNSFGCEGLWALPEGDDGFFKLARAGYNLETSGAILLLKYIFSNSNCSCKMRFFAIVAVVLGALAISVQGNFAF